VFVSVYEFCAVPAVTVTE
jgi:hypothetical protein